MLHPHQASKVQGTEVMTPREGQSLNSALLSRRRTLPQVLGNGCGLQLEFYLFIYLFIFVVLGGA
jgi:hypothetical protein